MEKGDGRVEAEKRPATRISREGDTKTSGKSGQTFEVNTTEKAQEVGWKKEGKKSSRSLRRCLCVILLMTCNCFRFMPRSRVARTPGEMKGNWINSLSLLPVERERWLRASGILVGCNDLCERRTYLMEIDNALVRRSPKSRSFEFQASRAGNFIEIIFFFWRTGLEILDILIRDRKA